MSGGGSFWREGGGTIYGLRDTGYRIWDIGYRMLGAEAETDRLTDRLTDRRTSSAF